MGLVFFILQLLKSVFYFAAFPSLGSYSAISAVTGKQRIKSI